jgi:hypothetical protein
VLEGVSDGAVTVGLDTEWGILAVSRSASALASALASAEAARFPAIIFEYDVILM